MAGKMIVFFLFVLTGLGNHVYGLQLKQVLVLSRHNLRTPLTSTLARMTPKEWPKWDVPVGNLTPKGALLESYMGDYFSEWLHAEGLLPDRCPEKKEVYIYANTRQRTKATSTAFTEAAFENCNITVNFKNMSQMDPIFNPVIHNKTETFKQTAVHEIQQKLNGSNLKDAYLLLNDITDIKNSKICKEEGFCDLTQDKNEIKFEVGEEPNVSGPFYIGNSMVDSFLMSLYEGLPMQDIAWGKIKNEEQWRLLTKVTRQNQNVRFNLTTTARDLTKPLLKFMKSRIETGTKFTLLVGHDSNLSPVLSSMGFKHYVLPEQFELTPVGSKLVFQKWTDGTNDFLKVEFVYQSLQQLRNAEKLSLSNPPKNITMHMKKCVTDNHGFCNWQDFEHILKDLVK